MTAQDDEQRPSWIELIKAHRSPGESGARSANERFVHGISNRSAPTDRVSIACECGAPICREVITLTFEDYEHVREHPAWSLVSAGHDNEDATIERRVGGGPGYVVVEGITPGDQEEA